MTTTETTERIDISEPLREICARLGLDYESVLEINFRPGDLTATVAKLNEHGSKHIEDGAVAKAEFLFRVRT